ncbi:hypothetical protein [Variovorax paradoxus]|uniref:hypothetical protein n=1 Tax=Variovorax paradoxus TaxID=34073 RepID=UPI0020A52D91|nr:hypothetical protein [Variovorax paradoxus]
MSRSFPAGPAAFSFAPQFWRLGWEGSRPAGFSQEVARSVNPSELPPSFDSESGGFCKSQPLEVVRDQVCSCAQARAENRCESAALQAGDDVEGIRQVHSAYVCLEKLIVPMQVNEREEIYPTRSEFGALFRLVNEELQRRIDAADSTIGFLRDALSKQVCEPAR